MYVYHFAKMALFQLKDTGVYGIAFYSWAAPKNFVAQIII